ncbi:MAG TPA: Type 1 glutamine amidotransferase-like domain-containing protein [Actinomycetes bacterium]|nr:Type 1 glutamine amidotransferase-like domain-containing protein [Actinomycetes bacterium]
MICLQGGAEFGAKGAGMDAELLRLAGAGPVVVTALAGAEGREYDTANRNGVRHFGGLGAVDVVAAPDARQDEAAAYECARVAALLVLPGGSPSRLLAALTSTRMGLAVREVLDRGGLVMGASAGAMVLCEHTWLPDRDGQVVPGLGLVPGCLVLPHWEDGRGGRAEEMAQRLPGDAVVLGLPEQSGVLVSGPDVTAMGHRAVALLGRERRVLAPGTTGTLAEHPPSA